MRQASRQGTYPTQLSPHPCTIRSGLGLIDHLGAPFGYLAYTRTVGSPSTTHEALGRSFVRT
eukprot:6731563-Prymnesium_polylepis.1